jgi:hypothetical protein
VRGARHQQLEQTVAALRIHYGDGVLRRASELSSVRSVPHIPTGFGQLDALTGCGGIPQGALTLLRGRTTSGKLTLAYKTLASLHTADPVAIAAVLDLAHSADPDYLSRCGVDLTRLLLLRPESSGQAVDSLLDLTQEKAMGAVVVNSLPHLLADRRDARYVNGHLALLHRHLQTARCALLCLDEPQPPWLTWLGWGRAFDIEQWSALTITLKREQWIYRGDELVGYRASARLHKSRFAVAGGSAAIEIQFNGTVRAGSTW